MKELMELMKSKGKPVKDGMYKNTKLGMLEQLQQAMEGEMGKDLSGLKKVSVAASSKEGLKEGLDKAEELVSGASEDEKEAEEDPLKELVETVTAPDDIDKAIALLQQKKQTMSQGKTELPLE